MPRKLSTIKALSLLPFLAILFLSVVAPVIHPALHEHAGIHVHEQHHFGIGPSFTAEDETDACPICVLLASSHLQTAGERRITVLLATVPSLLSELSTSIDRLCLLLPESRAPPVYTS